MDTTTIRAVSLGGVTLGYNFRVNDKWIAGVEGDLSMADIKGKDNMYWGDGHHWHTGWGGLATLRGRVGYEYDPRTLIYGTAGLAIIDSSEYNIGDKGRRPASDNSGWKVGMDGRRRCGTRDYRPLVRQSRISVRWLCLTTAVMAAMTAPTYHYNDANVVRVGVNYKIN